MVPSQQSTFDGVDITRADELDLLGTVINSDMRWNAHIKRIANEASKCIGFLKRCTKYFSPLDLRNIYYSHIRPKMEYNSHIWAGASKESLKLLDRVQDRVIKLIGDLEVVGTIDSLERRRKVGSISLFYRYFHGECSVEIAKLLPAIKIFGRNSRSSVNAHAFHLNEISERTTHYRDSFLARNLRIWNKLPANVFPDVYNPTLFKQNINCLFSATHPQF